MTLKNDEKFEEKLTCGLKNDMNNLDNFHQSAIKSKNWNFDGIFLFKAENSWTWNLQRRYMSWQWRMMQYLKRNWLNVSIFTWEIRRNLIQTLERLKPFNCFYYDNICTKREGKNKQMKKYKGLKLHLKHSFVMKAVQDINISRCIYSSLQINEN